MTGRCHAPLLAAALMLGCGNTTGADADTADSRTTPEDSAPPPPPADVVWTQPDVVVPAAFDPEAWVSQGGGACDNGHDVELLLQGNEDPSHGCCDQCAWERSCAKFCVANATGLSIGCSDCGVVYADCAVTQCPTCLREAAGEACVSCKTTLCAGIWEECAFGGGQTPEWVLPPPPDPCEGVSCSSRSACLDGSCCTSSDWRQPGLDNNGAFALQLLGGVKVPVPALVAWVEPSPEGPKLAFGRARLMPEGCTVASGACTVRLEARSWDPECGLRLQLPNAVLHPGTLTAGPLPLGLWGDDVIQSVGNAKDGKRLTLPLGHMRLSASFSDAAGLPRAVEGLLGGGVPYEAIGAPLPLLGPFVDLDLDPEVKLGNDPRDSVSMGFVFAGVEVPFDAQPNDGECPGPSLAPGTTPFVITSLRPGDIEKGEGLDIDGVCVGGASGPSPDEPW